MDILIEEYIPAGYANRISRSELQMRTGLSDRVNRRLIEDARERMVLIISANGGYFQYLDERDDVYAREYMAKENSRFKSQSHKNKLMRLAWAVVHPEDRRRDKGQIPGANEFVRGGDDQWLIRSHSTYTKAGGQ